MKKIWLLPMVLLPLFYLCWGCTGQNKEASTIAPVVLSVDSIIPTTSPFGDVRTNVDDTVEVTLSNHLKDPDATSPTHFADVIVTSYRVSFTRTDGGTAVPSGFEQAITYRVPANGSTTITGLVVVKAYQKLYEPLGYLMSLGYEPSTNLPTISCNIIIEFTGETEAGYKVYAKGSVPITFAAYPDSQ